MKDYTYRYSVSMTTVQGFNTPAGWATASRVGHRIPAGLSGKPNVAKLERYVADYNASILPGGCNAHLGLNARCTAASIYDHQSMAVVAVFVATGA